MQTAEGAREEKSEGKRAEGRAGEVGAEKREEAAVQDSAARRARQHVQKFHTFTSLLTVEEAERGKERGHRSDKETHHGKGRSRSRSRSPSHSPRSSERREVGNLILDGVPNVDQHTNQRLHQHL